jgi:hypothetical protein
MGVNGENGGKKREHQGEEEEAQSAVSGAGR